MRCPCRWDNLKCPHFKGPITSIIHVPKAQPTIQRNKKVMLESNKYMQILLRS